VAKRRKCAVANCPRDQKHGDYCNPHYVRWRRNGDPGVTEIRPRTRATIPMAPLLAYLERKGIELKDIREDHSAVYRQLWRGGLITEYTADRLACDFLQVHPLDVWDDWYELTSEEVLTAAKRGAA
jgi:hypothetical protein